MKKLNRSLTRWVNANLISTDQMQNILKFENGKKSEGRPKWILYGFLSLGICVICIGIISLIAANWADIPGIIKLAFDFIILAGVAFVIYRFGDSENAYIFDGLSLLFALLCFGTIGLISQVYHTGGELWQALAVWLVITIPPTHITRKKLLPHIWILAFLLAQVLWLTSDVSPWEYLSSSSGVKNIFDILFALSFLCLILNIVFEHFKTTRRYGEIFKLWVLLGSMYVAVAVDLYYSILSGGPQMESMIPMYAFAIVSLILLHAITKYSVKHKIIISIIIILTAVIFLPYEKLHSGYYYLAGDLIGASFSIIIFLLFSMLFILDDRQKLFNLATLLIGLRFLIIYFQVFGSLVSTGFGLIVSGLLIIGTAFLWFKKRGKFENWLKGKIK
ncbi:MAG: DUF2157 domain-containing protein [Acidobacteria bacterium]|nr:DUF2157 domain-containing protein [Acidobacteriota bacterium]